jgi:hypothetical protein
MNLRIIGLGGLLGIVVFVFSQLLVISWAGEITFYEPSKNIVVFEMVIMIMFMAFACFLLVEEIKKKKLFYEE